MHSPMCMYCLLTPSNTAQVKALEEKCAKSSDELKAASDEVDRLQTELSAARKVFWQNLLDYHSRPL
jgi:hypothetical protein